MKIKKTNALRELDKHRINYSLIEYEVNEEYLGAIHVAAQTGSDITKVFKTIALMNDKKELIIACVPGSDELSLKKLGKEIGDKKLDLLNVEDLKKFTGYVRGGCSPIGILKKHSSFIHESALEKDFIIVSGGRKGLQVQLNPNDLIILLNMKVLDLIIS